ncbi:MAG: ABC transporter [Anaerolineaceae bacterium 4572_78]|nr:MAG: ABC transporter [Anaerolineaceae bacterium 4572_78]
MSEYYDEFQEEKFNTQINTTTIRRIAQLVLPYKKLLAGFMVFLALASILDATFTYLSKLMIDEGIIAGDVERLTELVFIYGVLIFVQTINVFSFITMTGTLRERINYDLHRKTFNHLQTLSLDYFNKTPIGWIMSRVTSDPNRVADFMSWGLLDASWGVLGVSISVVFMLYINWKMTIIVMCILPIIIVVAMKFRRLIIAEFRKVRRMTSYLTSVYEENITGVRVVKAFTREQKNLAEFDEKASELYHASYRAEWLSALFLPLVQLISAFALGAIIWYGGWQVRAGGMTIGDIQAFISYLVFILFPIYEMSRVYAKMQESIASAERIFSLWDTKPTISDKPEAFDPGTLRADIKFEDVDFQYDAGNPVLKDFNLYIKRGETIALVGPTGAGKSTIVKLICRFYEPTNGMIRIGGTDYTDLSLHAIHSRIGMVLQTPHLFSGTIRENIHYGRLDATDAEIEEASKLAHAHDFITALENGYDTEVGEGGSLLSVGQKQLISLARAVLADPDIFIMDEATSSVDTVTESLIQKGMETLMAGRTSLVIAHRLSTIKQADRIMVIDNGGISEMGTHADLIREKGHYYSLYTNQFREELAHQYDAVLV